MSAPDPEAAVTPGQPAYEARLDELLKPVKDEVDRLRGEVAGGTAAPVPLPLGEYARQLERQLAEAGRELIRLASAERDASEERDDLARRIAGVAPMLGELRRLGEQLEGERAALEAERDGLVSRLRALADTWDSVALGMNDAASVGRAEELAERARELRLVMRMAGVKPEERETATEWAVFWGGPDPDSCAGYAVAIGYAGDAGRAAAEEEAQWRIQAGIARRTVSYGPWEVMTGDDDGTETAAILSDPEAMAAIAEGLGELDGEARP